VKWARGFATEAGWQTAGSISTTQLASASSSAEAAVAALGEGLAGTPVTAIVVSNVAGPEVEAALRLAAGRCPILFVRATAGERGVRNHYDAPAQLGSDRFAALIATHGRADASGCAKLVVMVGTTMTVDALDAEGNFLGGAIVPGLEIMRHALNQATAQLPLIEDGRLAPQDFGHSTEAAILLGGEDALMGAIARGLARLRAAKPDTEIALLASGGGLQTLREPLDRLCAAEAVRFTIAPDLVLDGLRLISAPAISD